MKKVTSINSRLRKFEKSLKAHELALLWLTTAQARGGFADYWKVAEFVPWASESEEAGMLYSLVFEINGAVFIGVDRWTQVAGVASVVALMLLGAAPGSSPLQHSVVGNLEELWRHKLCGFLEDVITVARAAELISDMYFDGHDVLFSDNSAKLAAAYESAECLILGYNLFAVDHGKEVIDIGAVEPPFSRVQKVLSGWITPCRAAAIAGCGRIFEARDFLVSWLSEQGSSAVGLQTPTDTVQTGQFHRLYRSSDGGGPKGPSS